MLAFLRLEKLRVLDVPAAAMRGRRGRDPRAGRRARCSTPAIRGGTTRAGRSRPRARRRSTFSWDHDYSPLDWPRDGRELLRVKARLPAYWKARDLDAVRRAQLAPGPAPARRGPLRAAARQPGERGALAPADPGHAAQPAHRHASSPPGSPPRARRGRLSGRRRHLQRAGPARARRLLHAPTSTRRARPNGSCATTPAPTTRTGCGPSVAIFLPPRRGARRRRRRRAQRAAAGLWPPWGESGGRPRPSASATSSARRADARRQRHGARVGARAGVEAGGGDAVRVRRGVEALPRRRLRLLRDAAARGRARSTASCSTPRSASASSSPAPRRCCCGWAASPRGSRPASRPGSFDDDQHEYVVRDLDAHSWVEAWFPGYGWVDARPDAGRCAAALAARRRGGRGAPGAARRAGPRRRAPERPRERPRRGAGRGPRPASSWRWSAASCSPRSLIAGALLERRRRRRLPPPAQRPMAEFERALRRARFDGGPGMTLSRIERELLRLARRGRLRARAARAALLRPPGARRRAEQRRGLRAALARDAGVLRAWWALPPRAGTSTAPRGPSPRRTAPGDSASRPVRVRTTSRTVRVARLELRAATGPRRPLCRLRDAGPHRRTRRARPAMPHGTIAAALRTIVAACRIAIAT